MTMTAIPRHSLLLPGHQNEVNFIEGMTECGMLWNPTRSSRQDARRRTEDGRRTVSRDHLPIDSIWSKLPPLSVPVSPSPVSREASRDFTALDYR